jgi:hypothetical protein
VTVTPESEPEPDGILNPGAIDDITTDGDLVTLHVTQTSAWDGSDQLLLLLQEKLYNYLAFVADGELARRHPVRRSGWRVRVDCWSEPDARTTALLRQADGQFRALGGALEVTVRPPMPRDR